MVSVCYPPLVSGQGDEIEAVARAACAEAGVPDAILRPWKRTVILNECPLLKKSRIAYFCLPADPDADSDAGPGDAGAGAAPVAGDGDAGETGGRNGAGGGDAD